MPLIQLTPGATEADIIDALNALPGGGTIILPRGELISITSGLSINVAQRDITLDLNGSTLQQAANVSVITGRGQHPAPEPVLLGNDTSGNVTLTYAAAPPDISSGSWLKVVSDDTLPGDHLDANGPTRMGQAMEVLSVEGNIVTLRGELIDQWNYSTNTRATPFLSGQLIVKNGEITDDLAQSSRNAPLIQLRNTIDAEVEKVVVHDASGIGISVVDGVNTRITDVEARNMADSSGALGIGVHSLSSTGTTVSGLYAENVTHAADNNAIGSPADSASVTYYGGDIGMHVRDSVAYAARNFAWSWHSEAVNGRFDHVLAFDSHGFLMARGIGGTMSDSGGANNERGIVFYQWGDGDGRDITIDGVMLKETQYYSTAAINNPQDNQIVDSYFESYSYTTPLDPQYATTANTVYARTSNGSLDDLIAGTPQSDLLLGGQGDDVISADAGNDHIWGGAGADTLAGGDGRDRFAFHDLGEAGDVISDFEGGASGDLIDLAVMNARLGWRTADPFADGFVRLVQNGADVQVLVDDDGGDGNFTTLATLGDIDAASVSAANIRINLSAGEPTDNVISGGPGNDRLFGTAGDDVLKGGEGNDTLYAGEGNDRLAGGPGADVLSGSMGYDTAVYADAAIGAVADLADSVLNAEAAAGDLFSSIENLAGTPFADILWGNQVGNSLEGAGGDDRLYGRNGSDLLRGNGGNDFIDGGPRKDILTGGSEADTFYFASTAESGDTISDFGPDDRIALSADGFAIQDFAFIAEAAPAATAYTATMLYDTGSGTLSWDADGLGTQHAVLIATLSLAPRVGHSDFLVI